MVKVSIDGEIVECVQLEDQLCSRFGLTRCEVAPDLGEEGIPLRALGLAGAAFLRREIERGDHTVIGRGHGRTLVAAVTHRPHFEAKSVDFVFLLGGLTRNYAANPHDVMHSLAEKNSSNTYVLPVPFFANFESDRAILLAQPGVRDIFDLSSCATLEFVGMGTVDAGAQLVASGMIEPHEIAEIYAGGAIGEMMGHFFDDSGRVLKTTLSSRTLSVDLTGTGNDGIVVIAGGQEKIRAIRAVLNRGRLSGLITNEATARQLVQ